MSGDREALSGVPDDGGTGGLWRVLDVGEGALLAEFAQRVDPRINEAVLALANHVRSAAIAGVQDVVPTFKSVAVSFDPLRTDRDRVRDCLMRAARERAAPIVPRVHQIPIVYGGETGEDLDDVAATSGMSPDELIGLHASGAYRVYMLGFLPGFAYLGPLPAGITATRRPFPRRQVPAGALGVAGLHTGVYPSASPGGWALIGRSPVRMFHIGRASPATLAAGDRVRFVSVPTADWSAVDAPVAFGYLAAIEHGQPSVEVRAAGLLTTVQDLGRHGYQHLGVSVAGAMDEVSARIANAVVGNDRSAAVLEATVTGPELVCHAGATVAITGGDFSPCANGHPMPTNQAITLAPGARLSFGVRRKGARAYIAFAGGVQVAKWLGSRATHVPSAGTGSPARPLARGDWVGLGRSSVSRPARVGGPCEELGTGRVTLRVLPGPQYDHFPQAAVRGLIQARFVVSSSSNRMGYQLDGQPLPAPPGDMISDATFFGAIQVPPSGQPILLMADRQTTGGYPQLAIVIRADLPLAGQLAPGDGVQFEWTTLDVALSTLAARERQLTRFEDDVRR